jgi:hypothetical protein
MYKIPTVEAVRSAAGPVVCAKICCQTSALEPRRVLDEPATAIILLRRPAACSLLRSEDIN